MDQIDTTLTDLINEGGSFSVFSKGRSMLPLLREGKDSVLLSKPSSLKKNEIILFKRKDGTHVLHRITQVTADGYIVSGDNQCFSEIVVDEDVIAKVIQIFRKDKPIIGSLRYKIYVKAYSFNIIKKIGIRFFRIIGDL